ETFRFFADGFYSKEYELEVLPNPVLMSFKIGLDYPAYLHKSSESLQNTGDLTIPAGTKVSWVFNTQNTESVRMAFQDSVISISRSGENSFGFSRRFLRNDSYTVTTGNHFINSK